MKDEKGISLVELLATLAIFSIISTLLFGIIIHSQNNFQFLSKKNTLVQEANLAVSTLKSYHRKGHPYVITYDVPEKKAYIKTTSDEIALASDHFNVEIKLGHENYQTFTGDFVITDTKKPLFVWLQLSDSNGKSFVIETAIDNY